MPIFTIRFRVFWVLFSHSYYTLYVLKCLKIPKGNQKP